MDRSLFHYSYPQHLIAQHPLPERDQSRMMVLDRRQQRFAHKNIGDLADYLQAGDLLVFNDTKVFPARLKGVDERQGKVEILLLEPVNGNGVWHCLGKPLKKLTTGTSIYFSPQLQGTIFRATTDSLVIKLAGDEKEIEKIGLVPLPPYIRREGTELDTRRYQSIFAIHAGSAAAPTASFHFTEELLTKIKVKRVEIAFVTLHISRDTFLPIRTKDVTQHPIHGERFSIPLETQQKVNKAKQEKRRVIAVGTTVVRALESDWTQSTTALFIYPGYRFKYVDALLTNFHQPESTLLLLVSAFAGREFILDAYQKAIEKQYRLFSYGDAMLIF